MLCNDLKNCVKNWLNTFQYTFSDIQELDHAKSVLSKKLLTYGGSLKTTTQDIINLIDSRITELTPPAKK